MSSVDRETGEQARLGVGEETKGKENECGRSQDLDGVQRTPAHSINHHGIIVQMRAGWKLGRTPARVLALAPARRDGRPEPRPGQARHHSMDLRRLRADDADRVPCLSQANQPGIYRVPPLQGRLLQLRVCPNRTCNVFD